MGKYNLRRHLRSIFVFFAMSCATVIYTNIDTLMLGFMKGDYVVGCYDASIKIKTVLVSIVTSLGAVVLPRASYYVEQNRIDEFKDVTKKALTFVWVVATPMVVYFIAVADHIILFLSGTAYTSSIVPMQIIMPTLLLIGISNILGLQVLVPLGKEKIVLISEIAGALVDILINATFIPLYGATGAAIGTLIAEFVVTLIQFISLRAMLGTIFKQLPILKVFVAIIPFTAIFFILPKCEFSHFVALIVSSIIFFGGYIIVLVIEREHFTITVFQQILGRLKKLESKKR